MGMQAPRFAHVELYRNVGVGPLSADDWDGQMLFFLEKGFRVIAHDRRVVDELPALVLDEAEVALGPAARILAFKAATSVGSIRA